jgi:hypothetical protein
MIPDGDTSSYRCPGSALQQQTQRDSIAAVALARNLGPGNPPLSAEGTALINRFAKGSICLAPDVALVCLMKQSGVRVCSLLSFFVVLSLSSFNGFVSRALRGLLF